MKLRKPDFRRLATDTRRSFKRPSGKSLATASLPIVFCIAIAIAMFVLLHYAVGQDPEQWAEEFAAKYERWVYVAIFFITFFNSLTVLLLAPGNVVVMALVGTLDLNLGWAALAGSLGGSLGEISGWWMGYSGRVIINTESSHYQRAERWTQRYGGWSIAALSFLPLMPFDIAGIVAGVLKYPWNRFLLFCWIGRFPRNLIEYSIGATLIQWLLPHLPWI